MIIANVIGGLGNQMFQYAAGYALAASKHVPLQLDLSGFDGYALHNGFELSRVFDLVIEPARDAQVGEVLGWQAHPAVRRILRRPVLGVLRKRGFIVEPHIHYWPAINQAPPASYLLGYWQSEKYFSAVETDIRATFQFKQALSGLSLELSTLSQSVNAVSLHIRRGDYISDPKANALMEVCGLDYYRAAVEFMAKHVPDPYFFVFSDDPEWVKDNLKIPFQVVYVDHNRGADSYIDMRLMSLCKHHIIANSSFSWWGAWLNPSREKIVVAPRKWFKRDSMRCTDLVPGAWVRL